MGMLFHSSLGHCVEHRPTYILDICRARSLTYAHIGSYSALLRFTSALAGLPSSGITIEALRSFESAGCLSQFSDLGSSKVLHRSTQRLLVFKSLKPSPKTLSIQVQKWFLRKQPNLSELEYTTLLVGIFHGLSKKSSWSGFKQDPKKKP